MKATVRINCGESSLVRRGAAALALLVLTSTVCLAQVQPLDFEGRIIADVIPVTSSGRSGQTEKVMSLVKTKPGAKYSRAIVDEDVRRLAETHSYDRPSARPELTPDGKVIVYFEARELHTVVREVVYEGAKHIKPDDLDSLTGIRKGMPMNPNANRQACQAIIQRYQEKGRLLAQVNLVEGDKYGDERVVFNITEGPVIRVSSIQFVGHNFVSASRLETQISTSRTFLGTGIGGIYNPAMLDADVMKLKDYYKSNGFHDIDVSREVEWESDMRRVRIKFHICEGQQYRIANVSLHGNSVMKDDEILRFVKLHPGDVYNKGTIDGDMAAIKDFYGYRGYGVPVNEEVYYPEDRPGQVDVHYDIIERPPATVGEVKIIGNNVTRENVIRRQVPLYSGQTLEYPNLRQAERNLARLNIFDNNAEQGTRPTVTVDDSTDGPVKDVLVTVHETQTGSLLFGLGANSNAGLTGSIVLNERNFDIFRPPTSFDDLLSGRAFRGGGQEFRIEAMPGTQLQRYTVSFREPFLFDTPYSFGVSGYYYNRYFNEYTEGRVGSQITVGRQINQNWSASTGLRIEGINVYNVPYYAPETFQEVTGPTNFLLGLRAGVKYDSRDSYLRPTEGSVVDFAFEECLGSFTFPVGSIDANKYWTIYQRPDGSGRHVLAGRSMASVTGSNAPVYERLYAGGFRTIRGFQFRGVGPNQDGFMVGGDFMFLNSLEYQIPVKANDQIYLVGFLDTGTVESSVEIKDYRVVAGVGVRITVPMLGPMPIALDFGIPIVKKDTDREQVFNFFVGYYH